jgi:hypothetical protein
VTPSEVVTELEALANLEGGHTGERLGECAAALAKYGPLIEAAEECAIRTVRAREYPNDNFAMHMMYRSRDELADAALALFEGAP